MTFGEKVILAAVVVNTLVLAAKTLLQGNSHRRTREHITRSVDRILSRLGLVEDSAALAQSKAQTAAHAAGDLAETVGRIEAKVSAPGDSGHALPAWKPGDTDRRQ